MSAWTGLVRAKICLGAAEIVLLPDQAGGIRVSAKGARQSGIGRTDWLIASQAIARTVCNTATTVSFVPVLLLLIMYPIKF
jgi:hypothetical protein